MLQFDETIFFHQVILNSLWGVVIRIVSAGMVTYVVGFDCLATVDTNNALEELVDNDSQCREIIGMVGNDGMLVRGLLVGTWIKGGRFRLRCIIVERKINNFWLTRWTKNNILWLLFDRNNR